MKKNGREREGVGNNLFPSKEVNKIFYMHIGSSVNTGSRREERGQIKCLRIPDDPDSAASEQCQQHQRGSEEEEQAAT